MFSGFGIEFLKKKLFAAKSKQSDCSAELRTIEVELTSASKTGVSRTTEPKKRRSASRAGGKAKEPKAAVSREAVAARAKELWLSEGCPEGKQLEHWLRAEKELLGR